MHFITVIIRKSIFHAFAHSNYIVHKLQMISTKEIIVLRHYHQSLRIGCNAYYGEYLLAFFHGDALLE